MVYCVRSRLTTLVHEHLGLEPVDEGLGIVTMAQRSKLMKENLYCV